MTTTRKSLTITFVTGNANKLREVKEILSSGVSSSGDDIQIEVNSQNLDIPEVQGTTQEIAIAKCKRAAELVNGPCITEDTALGFKALGGLPGPYIKDFLKNLGHAGLNTLLTGFPTKQAEAICTFAYSAGPGSEPIIFEGKTEGTIVDARGPADFGWDPVFEPLGTGLTYAEMPSEQKNKLSHRGKALEKLKKFMQNLPDV